MRSSKNKRREAMKIKRYWFRDWRDDKEYVTSAFSKKDLIEKVGTNRIQILQTYYNKGVVGDLILLY